MQRYGYQRHRTVALQRLGGGEELLAEAATPLTSLPSEGYRSQDPQVAERRHGLVWGPVTGEASDS